MTEAARPYPPVSAVFLCLLLLMAMALPLAETDNPSLRPLIPLMFCYFFTIERRRALPLAALAGLGLLQDSLVGGILGLNMILLVATRLLLEAQAPAYHAWPVLIGWLGFVPVAAIAAAIIWAMGCLASGTLISPAQVLVQTLLTLAAYPLAAHLFEWRVRREVM